MYAPNGAAVRIVAELFGEDVIDASSGAVDRRKLGAVVIGDDAKMRGARGGGAPTGGAAREEFVASRASDDVVLFDIPLLYEKGYEKTVDAVCVVSTGDEATQRERVMKRRGMTRKINGILARQMPDAEKRAKADYVIDTSCSLEETRARVEEILRVFTRLSGEE